MSDPVEPIEPNPVGEDLQDLHAAEPAAEPEGGAAEPVKVEPKSALTADDVTNIARAVRESTLPTEATREYTQEELDKMFNTYQPTMDLITAIREGDEKGAIAAVAAMRDGLLKQFDTLTQYRLQLLEQKLSPGLQTAAGLAAAREEENFFSENSDLVDRKEVVKMVFNDFKASGKRFPDVASANKAIADRTRTLLGIQAPAAGTNGSQPTPKNNNNAPKKQPATLSSGSQAGGGGAAATGNVFQEIHS